MIEKRGLKNVVIFIQTVLSFVWSKKIIHIYNDIDFYILIKSIISYNKKLLQNSLNAQQKKLSSLTRDCNLPIFITNETILTQYELSHQESDLLKAGL